jgi:hypothetical protein
LQFSDCPFEGFGLLNGLIGPRILTGSILKVFKRKKKKKKKKEEEHTYIKLLFIPWTGLQQGSQKEKKKKPPLLQLLKQKKQKTRKNKTKTNSMFKSNITSDRQRHPYSLH